MDNETLHTTSDKELLLLQAEILKNITEGVYLVRSSDGMIVYTNPKFEEMFGYASGEMIGKNVAIVNAPDVEKPEEKAKEIMDIIARTGEWHGEVKNIKKDGTVFWCYANVSIFNHQQYGKVLVAAHTDISERRRAQIEGERYRQLFLASRDAIMTIEPPQWKFTSANPATVQLFHAKDETEVLSLNPWQLSPGMQPSGTPSQEAAKSMIEKALREGSSLFEWVHKRIDGEEFDAEVLLSRVGSGKEAFLFAMLRDITERKKERDATERLNKVMVGRELEMKRLKDEKAALAAKLSDKQHK